MAALLVLIPEAPPARRGSPMVLAAGLVAVITGVALLLGGLLLPVPPLDAIAVPRTAVNRAAGVRIDVGQGVSRVSEDLRLFPTMTPPDISNSSEPAATNDRGGVDQLGPGILSSDLIEKVRRLRTCMGTNAESTHFASVPLCSDARGALMEMAAAAYRGSWTR
jgi:hypothetical protein